jgi:hypothetical protein
MHKPGGNRVRPAKLNVPVSRPQKGVLLLSGYPPTSTLEGKLIAVLTLPPLGITNETSMSYLRGGSDDVMIARRHLNHDHTVPGITHEQYEILQPFAFGLTDGNGVIRVEHFGNVVVERRQNHGLGLSFDA